MPKCNAKVSNTKRLRLEPHLGFKVSRFPHAEFKSFTSRELAEEWLGGIQCQSVVWSILLMRRLARSVLNVVSPVDASREPSKDSKPPHPELAPDATTGSPPQDVKLSEQQEDILKYVKAGNSVFFTGSAGTYSPSSSDAC